MNCTFDVDGQEVGVEMWDTAGQERFHAMTSTYYRGADAILLMYSVDSEVSFQRIPDWLDDARKFSPDDLVLGLFGNKCDLPPEQHQVTQEVAQAFADADGGEEAMPLYLVSAKEGTNCRESFMDILSAVMKKRNSKKKVIVRTK